ncbi:competence protein ComEA [Enterococcus sp. DIV0212c]|uniref:helix-hairpin-helix domain-containing protein n=1 Tax=Enterococcus sp. DIV0212c TaxID=2230867 RepID=UPI001A9BDC42|nr:helix-hairpin-helix domain-containing protein [Enterococcus sp. DIV0212c]MBO1352490.1 helix-hairpin-helix domain-containing protein [Enterococcus sp. DIV0212c]
MDYGALLQKYKQYVIGGVILSVVLCSLVILFLAKSNPEPLAEEELTMTSVSSSIERQAESLSKQIYVDIKGAVKKPGMYEGTADMRVWDAVMLAGGVSDEADTKQVNFSERIIDQMVIYVPKVGEEIQSTGKTNDSQGIQNKETNKINLNQANETELQALPGIGQKKAQEIIRYREENGGFKSIEDLKNISGFGEKTFEKLKDSITS